MLSNTKLSTLVLKTHLNFKSFTMINYVKENKKYFSYMMGYFFSRSI